MIERDYYQIYKKEVNILRQMIQQVVNGVTSIDYLNEMINKRFPATLNRQASVKLLYEDNNPLPCGAEIFVSSMNVENPMWLFTFGTKKDKTPTGFTWTLIWDQHLG